MKKTISLIMACIACLSVKGQVETKIYTKGEKIDNTHAFAKKRASKTYKLPTFDATKMLAEDKEMEGCDVPFRFGKGFDVNLTLKDGIVEGIKGGKIWSLSFEAKDAYSLNFVFDNFHLAVGAELYIVNKDENIIYGPVTSNAINKNGYFLTDVIPDSQVTIYLYEPIEVADKSTLTIKRVVYGYKKVFVDMNGGLVGSSSPCNNDIACFPEYADEAKAVALVLLADGTELCSGSLLMTADYSFKPYFLTAFHCIDTKPIYTQGNGIISSDEIADAENWMFKFNYMKSSCTGSSIKTAYTYNSATFRAAWNNTDFALMEINHDLSQYEGRHSWLGWDRSGNVPTNGVGIHHPAGDVMKISIENDPFLSSSWNNSGVLNHWLVNFDDGVIEKGSSGSPILNSDNNVVGQLHGGPAYQNHCNQKKAYYGKFNLSWIGGGTNNTRLSNWLDPNGSGITVLASVESFFISGPSQFFNEATYTVLNVPEDCTVEWTSNYPSILTLTPQTSNGSQVKCTMNYMAGEVYGILTAKVKCNGNVIKTLTKNIHAGLFITGISPYDYCGVRYVWAQTSAGSYIVPGMDFEWSAANGVTFGENPYLDDASFSYYGNAFAYPVVKTAGYYDMSAYIKVNNIAVSNWYTSSVYLEPGSLLPGGLFSVFPNPATNLVTVQLQEATEENTTAATTKKTNTAAATDGTFEVQLWSNSRMVDSTTGHDRNAQLNVSSLPAGLYYVVVIKDGETYRQKLIVK